MRGYSRLLGRIFNCKGGSLLQVLLGSTAVAGMVLIGLELSKDQKRLARKTSAIYEMKYLEDEVLYLLENKKNCWANFGEYLISKDPNFNLDYLISLTIDDVTKRDKQIVRMKSLSAGGQLLGQGNIYIKGYELDEIIFDDSKERSGSFKLLVDLVHRNKEKVETVYRKEIPIYFTLDNSQFLGECTTVQREKMDASTWTNNINGGINYSAGRLGVGINKPITQLHVEGGVLLKEGVDLSCKAKDKGTMRYLDTQKAFQVCDGLNWVNLGRGSDRFTDYQIYKHKIKSKLKEVFEIPSHRICTVTRLQKNQSRATCILSRLTQEVSSKYNLALTAENLKIDMNCEVWCYD